MSERADQKYKRKTCLMPGKCFLTVVLLVGICLNLTTAKAEDQTSPFSSGLRYGTSLRGEGIDQYDLLGVRNLPWSKAFDSGWKLDSLGELSANFLHGQEENGLSASLSTDILLISPGQKISFSSGVGVGVLEDYVLGDYDFGGPVFFLFHAGASLHLSPRISIGYRYSHQSNGRIYLKNPSLNLSQIELRYSF